MKHQNISHSPILAIDFFLSDTSPSPAPRARPVPAGGRPKPNLKAVAKPRATVLYDYSAGDTDEISLFQGEIIEINQEG